MTRNINASTKRRSGILFALAVSLSFTGPILAEDKPADAKAEKPTAKEDKAESKTKKVEIRDLKLQIPESWKEEKPSNNFRLAQISIPAVDGDEQPAELTVSSFPGGGGEIDQNLTRWVSQFGGKGKTAKLTKGETDAGAYYFANIAGTFNQRNFRTGTSKAMPGSRMLGAIVMLEKPKAVYYLKVVGPDKTVAAAADEFRKSFGGNAEKEKEYEIEK